MEAVTRLGFQPNLMARNIRRGSPDSTIGLVVPDMGNPFFGTVDENIEDAVRERGLTLPMGSSAEDPAQERALIETFISRRVRCSLGRRASRPPRRGLLWAARGLPGPARQRAPTEW